MDLLNELEKKVYTNPKKLVIWAGAGVSGDSGLPLGDELTKSILECAFKYVKSDMLPRITSIYRRLYGKERLPRLLPRLEFVLDRLFEYLRKDPLQSNEDPLQSIKDIFGKAEPNKAHEWLSKFSSKGCNIITPNFDCLIKKGRGDLYNYHGTYKDAKRWMGILRQIASGIKEKEIDDRLHKLLEPAEYVLFIGYSGRDYYDVLPFFEGKKKQYNVGFWIKHNNHALDFEEITPPEEIEFASEAFYSFHCFKGNTRYLYINDKLGIPMRPCRNSIKNKRQLNWRRNVQDTFQKAGQACTCLFILDLLSKMGLDELGLEFLRHIQLVHEGSFKNKEDRMDLNVLRLEIYHNSSKYQTILQEVRRLRKDDIPKPVRRRHTVSSSLFTCSFSRFPFLLSRTKSLLKDISDRKLPLEEIRVAYERIKLKYHILRGFNNVICKVFPFLNEQFKQFIIRNCQNVQSRLYKYYMELVSTGKVQDYDEELAQLLRTEASPGDSRLPKRWKESDNLKRHIITKRFLLLNKISKKEKTQCPEDDKEIRSEIEEGIEWTRLIGNHLEMICWLTLASQYQDRKRKHWDRLRRGAKKRIEWSVLAERLFLREVLQQPSTGR